MVNPGGTGRPSRPISASPAPLPPSKSTSSLPPSAKSYTYFRAVVDRARWGVGRGVVIYLPSPRIGAGTSGQGRHSGRTKVTTLGAPGPQSSAGPLLLTLGKS